MSANYQQHDVALIQGSTNRKQADPDAEGNKPLGLIVNQINSLYIQHVSIVQLHRSVRDPHRINMKTNCL